MNLKRWGCGLLACLLLAGSCAAQVFAADSPALDIPHNRAEEPAVSLMTVTRKEGDQKEVRYITDTTDFETLLYQLELATIKVDGYDKIAYPKDGVTYVVKVRDRTSAYIRLAQVEAGDFSGRATVVREGMATRWGDEGLIRPFEMLFYS